MEALAIVIAVNELLHVGRQILQIVVLPTVNLLRLRVSS
jgi:hypothetical protein